MKTTLYLIATCLTLYLFSLIYNLPAAWVYQQLSPPFTKLASIQGTLWSGKAQQVNFQKTPVGTVTWKFIPNNLLTGKLTYQLTINNGTSVANGFIHLLPDLSIQLQDIQAQASLADILPLYGPMPMTMNGHTLLKIDNILIKNNKLLAFTGILKFKNMMLPPDTGLGNYQAQINLKKEGLVAVFKDQKATLELAGTLLLTKTGFLKISGNIANRDNKNIGLTQMLAFIGKPSSGGKRKFSVNKKTKLRF